MIVRHIETRPPAEPAVRFYRTIAATFLILTVVLLGVVIFITSKKATLVILAKEDNKSVNLMVGVSQSALKADADTVAGMVTSSVWNWSEKFYSTGSKTIDGLAVGEAVIYNKSDFDQPLVKTTRLLTPTGVLFRLSDRVLVPANGQVIAKVYADQAGAGNDIGPSQFVIPGLSTDKQKVIYAESLKAMSGGVKTTGVLSEADIQAAKKSYSEKAKQSFVQSLAALPGWSGYQVVGAIVGQDMTIDQEVEAEVSEFTVSGKSTLVAAAYSAEALRTLVNRAIAAKVDSGMEKVLAVNGEPKLSLVSYDLSADTAQLSVYQEVLATLDANAEKLSPQYFMGKSKEEIERYVLGLDHVVGVEVKFSPSWMGSAPSVPEKIKIVVKSVK